MNHIAHEPSLFVQFLRANVMVKGLLLFWPAWLLAAVAISILEPPFWVVLAEVLAPFAAFVVFLIFRRHLVFAPATRLVLPAAAPKGARDAKTYLDTLRRDELSVMAAFRRGETVDKAPGQTSGSTSAPGVAPVWRRASPEATRTVKRAERESSGDDGFVTSMAVAAATDNAAIGYLAGRNLAGAAVGSALANSSKDSGSAGGDTDGAAGDSGGPCD